MITNRKLLEELRSKVVMEFSQLRLKYPTIIIEEDHEECDTYFEARCDQTGETYDVHVLKVDSKGIHCIEVNNTNSKIVLGLNDLSSIEYSVYLVELMDIRVKNKQL